jgi:glycosyltransferase involved in cell wall biosynthesis
VDLPCLNKYKKQAYESVRSFVTATRLIRRKNISGILRALSDLPKAELKIIGDGPLKNTLRKEARESGVAGRVEFVGYVTDREDVYRIVSESDAFVHPSYSEGFCVAVAEAMALGLPVIVSDIPVFHEVVGEGGIFVDPDRSRSIAEALRDLVENPEAAKKKGLANRSRIISNFDIREVVKKYRDVYLNEI